MLARFVWAYLWLGRSDELNETLRLVRPHVWAEASLNRVLKGLLYTCRIFDHKSGIVTFDVTYSSGKIMIVITSSVLSECPKMLLY